MGRNSGRTSVEDDLASQRSPRPVRRVTQKPPVWEDMKPKSRKKKAGSKNDNDGNVNNADKIKLKAKEKGNIHAAQPSVASRFRAPKVATNTSEDEAIDMDTAASKKATKSEKSLKLDKAVESQRPSEVRESQGKLTKTSKGKGKQMVDDTSPSEPDSRSSEEDAEEQELSPASGLEELEKRKPGALKAKFENERAVWLDDDARADDNNLQDDLQYDPQDDRQYDPQDDLEDRQLSRPGSAVGSPPGSPIRSQSRAGLAIFSSPNRSGSSRPSHRATPGSGKHARDESSEDERLSSPVPPAKKKERTSMVTEEDERKEKARKLKEREHQHRAQEQERKRRAQEQEDERERAREKKERERAQEKKERERAQEKKEKEKEQARKRCARGREDEVDESDSAEEHKRAKKQDDAKVREKHKAKERTQRTDGRNNGIKKTHGSSAVSGSRAGPSHAAKRRGRAEERSTSAPQGSRRKRVDENPQFIDRNDSDRDASGNDASSRPPPKRRRRYRRQDDGSDLLSESHDDDDDEDPRIDIVWYGSNRPNLTDQYPRVYRVARRAIRECEPNVCLLNAFPDEDPNFVRPVLIKHATTLGYKDMVKKLKSNKETDETYYRKFCSIPGQRVNLIRGKVKKACQRHVKTVYGLTVGDSEKVAWLLDGIAYIFPHNYQDGTVVGEEAFNCPIFEDMISDAFFSKKTSFGFRLIPHFASSDPEKPEEKEIPAAMLALISTAIYASIEDYKHDSYEARKFEVNSYLQVYKQNIAVLDDIKTGNPEAYHDLMHGLYTRIVGSNARPVPKKSYLNVAGMARR